ncbi:MAG: DivIVA domain-containing protein [Firmicutes bacterium]|nr:DivIVA domain-containing protein [Bacillota bacterium]
MKKFNTAFAGYDKNEVNKFVSDVTKNYEDILNKLKVADQEIQRLQDDLVKYKNMESTLNKAIVIANDTAHQIRKTTTEEAQSIINDARRSASRIINDALIKAEKAESDAQTLRRRVEIYKRKVTQAIDEQKELIETMDIDY